MSRALLRLTLLLTLLALPAVTQAQDVGGYAPSTGHTLTDTYGFLSFWQATGGERLLGLPVTEAAEVNGLTVQYFAHGRLERAADGAVGVGRAGADYLAALGRQTAAPTDRLGGGGLRFTTTGYTLREPFLSFWRANGGLPLLGAPLSDPHWELTVGGERQVQYFERVRLDRDPAQTEAAQMSFGRIGAAVARLRGLSTAAVANPGLPIVGPLPDAAAAPPLGIPPTPEPTAEPLPEPTAAPLPAAPAPVVRGGGGRSILVNLSRQWLYAYEGDTIVYDAPVTTGRDGLNTPTGTYSIYAKLPIQTMSGVDPTDGPWVVPNIPHVMYINGGVALHGTYWHNLFGSGVRVSHGCVNLPLSAAAWIYDWAAVGTPVTVTY